MHYQVNWRLVCLALFDSARVELLDAVKLSVQAGWKKFSSSEYNAHWPRGWMDAGDDEGLHARTLHWAR